MLEALGHPLQKPAHAVVRVRDAARIAVDVAPFAHPVPTMLRLLLPRLRLLCYPRQPSRWQILYKICALNGYRVVGNPESAYDVAIHFTSGGPCSLPGDVRVVNCACTDISKARVAAAFERTFGYGLAVDPLTYEDAILEKSNANYTHDGRILAGPLRREDLKPNSVYQRLIDTSDGEEVVDLRTPVYGGRVPFVYVKRRPLTSRFSNENTSVELRESSEIYSPEELNLLARLSSELGVEFGEFDVLRDRVNGQAYVVDVSNTPAGPPNGLRPDDARRAVHRLAQEFARLLGRDS